MRFSFLLGHHLRVVASLGLVFIELNRERDAKDSGSLCVQLFASMFRLPVRLFL